MISRGIEIAAKGMQSLIEQQDAIAHNLANVNTTGYKKEAITFKSVYNSIVSEPENQSDYKYRTSRDVGTISMGSQSHKLIHEFSQGAISRTGSALDMAIQGDGFFKVQSPAGDVSYTRNGNFVLNSQNFLTDTEGNHVLDNQNRPIQLNIRALGINSNSDLTINENGQICIVGRENTRNLQTVGVWDFSNKEDMRALGGAKYIPKNTDMNPELKAEKFSVQQGSLEMSNSNVVSEMINSINVSRNYETLSKLVKEKSSHISTAINIGILKG